MSLKVLLTLTLLSLLILVSVSSDPNESSESKLIGKVVQIEPVALDLLLSVHEHSVVYFMQGHNEDNIKLFQEAVKNYILFAEDQEFNKTLFAICDITKDVSGKLKKYGNKTNIQIFTPVSNYELKISLQNSRQNFFTSFRQFMNTYLVSKPTVLSYQSIEQMPYNQGFTLLLCPTNQQQLQKSKKIHRKISDYLHFFKMSAGIANDSGLQRPAVHVFYGGKLVAEYAQSAVEALFKFNYTDGPSKSQINDLVDFINIESISDVTVLSSENFVRVYGSSMIEYQMLLIYKQADKNNKEIVQIRRHFSQAANRNRKQGLKYQRILFAEGTVQVLREYFADEPLQNKNDLYSIIITKTDYSSFQLRKFVYQDKDITTEKLIQFIDDVKMKRIDATYKSQQIEDNQGKKIRKIVGKNFIHQVFEQPDNSVMVLFIDSKQQESYKSLKQIVEKFVDKYYQAYKDRLNVGIFDLAKNQHKSLTISSAPELVLFERSNKKKPKFIKGANSIQQIKNWINYQVKDLTIPENFGEPPIALGSPSSTQL